MCISKTKGEERGRAEDGLWFLRDLWAWWNQLWIKWDCPFSLSLGYIWRLRGLFRETDTPDKKAANLKRKKRGGLQPPLKSSHVSFRHPSAGCSPLYVLLHDHYCLTREIPNRRRMEMILGRRESPWLPTCKYARLLLCSSLTLKRVRQCQWNILVFIK